MTKILVVALLIAVIAGAYLLYFMPWQTVRVWPSPDGSSKVVFRQPFVREWGLEVVLVSERKEVLLEHDGGAVLASFEHVYWSPDSQIAGVFRCGNPRVEVAYDRGRAAKIAFPTVSKQVRLSIETAYGKQQHLLRRTGAGNGPFDPVKVEPVREDLDWACGELLEPFLAKHP